jgi:PAS domain-containing protein
VPVLGAVLLLLAGLWLRRQRWALARAERKAVLAEQALETSQTRFRSILDHAADAVFIANPQGRYVYANRQAGRLVGYTPEELMRIGIRDLTPDEELASGAASRPNSMPTDITWRTWSRPGPWRCRR